MRFLRGKLALAARVVTAFVMGLGMLVGFAAVPAAAAGCPIGANCHWYNTNFDGASVNMIAPYASFSGAVLNNRTRSIKANGSECARSYFYNFGDYTGDYFWLHSDTLTSTGQNEDPNLSNGAGYGPYNGQNWADRISSYKFSDC